MYKSEKAGIWAGLVIFLIGLPSALGIFLPVKEPPKHQVTLPLPAGSIEASFVEIDSLDDFEKLSLSQAYFEISYDADKVSVNFLGLDGITIYTGEEIIDWSEPYRTAGYTLEGNMLTVSMARDIPNYLLLSAVPITGVIASSFVVGVTVAAIVYTIDWARSH